MLTMFSKGSKTPGRRESNVYNVCKRIKNSGEEGRSIQCLLLQPILESPAAWTAAVSQSRETSAFKENIVFVFCIPPIIVNNLVQIWIKQKQPKTNLK